MLLLRIILLIIGVLLLLTGYAFLNNLAQDFLMWTARGKEFNISDKSGYRKQMGKSQ